MGIAERIVALHQDSKPIQQADHIMSIRKQGSDMA